MNQESSNDTDYINLQTNASFSLIFIACIGFHEIYLRSVYCATYCCFRQRRFVVQYYVLLLNIDLCHIV